MMDNPARPVVLITLSTPNANGFHSPIALDMTARHHTALQEEVKCRGILLGRRHGHIWSLGLVVDKTRRGLGRVERGGVGARGAHAQGEHPGTQLGE